VLLRRWPALHHTLLQHRQVLGQLSMPSSTYSVPCSPFVVRSTLGSSWPSVPPQLALPGLRLTAWLVLEVSRCALLPLMTGLTRSRSTDDSRHRGVRRRASLSRTRRFSWRHRRQAMGHGLGRHSWNFFPYDTCQRNRSGQPGSSNSRHLPPSGFEYPLDDLLPARPLSAAFASDHRPNGVNRWASNTAPTT